MFRKLRLLCLAGPLAFSFGCVVVDDDDDTGNSTGNATAGDVNPTTAANTMNGDTMGGDTMNADTMSADTAAETAAETAADTAAETAADDTAGETMADTAGETMADTAAESMCGWGEIDEKKIMEGYICGGEGEDPNGRFSSACPDIELMAGAECGSVTGRGCCDGEVLWFCANQGENQTLMTQDCAE